jgi:hypothetical protein
MSRLATIHYRQKRKKKFSPRLLLAVCHPISRYTQAIKRVRHPLIIYQYLLALLSLLCILYIDQFAFLLVGQPYAQTVPEKTGGPGSTNQRRQPNLASQSIFSESGRS